MKKLFKVMSLTVAILLSMGIFTTVSAKVTASPDKALELLQSLNIIFTKDKSDDFSEDKAVTKGDFSIYLVRALKMEPYGGEELPFSDISKDDAIYPYICALYQRGVVHGYNSEFNVNKKISYNEAVKMMIAAIGYGEVAELSGGYPSGYLSVAMELDILQNVKLNSFETITKKDAAALLFNMLNAELMEYNGLETVVKSEETMFSKLYDIYSTKGRVVRNSEVSLLAKNSPTRNGYVQIGDEMFREGYTDVSSYIGYEIEFYYQYDDKTDENTVLIITKPDGRNNEIYIKSEDIIDFSDNKYKYLDENEKIKTLTLADEYYMTYNMSYPSAGFTKEKMIPAYGGVRIIRGSNNSEPDVVMIDEYVSCAVNSVDVTRQIIYTKNKTSVDLSQVEYRIINSGGKEIELSAVKEWDVISQAWSSDNSQLVIYISNEAVNGTISSTGSEGGTDYIVIANKKYYVLDDCYNKSDIEINAGVTAYLDICGSVAGLDIEENKGMNYAYLMKAYMEEDEHGYIRIFDKNAKSQTYQLHDKVTINDVKYSSVENAVNYLRNLSEKIVKVEVNSQKAVSNMIVSDGTKDYIHKVEVIQKIWNANNKTFGGQATLTNDAPVFLIPPQQDESKYEVASISSFSHDTGYGDVEIYTDGDNVFAEAILRNAGSAASIQRNCAVVKSINNIVDDEGEITRSMEVLYNGALAKYELTTDVTVELGIGDILQIGFDLQGKIANVIRLYDAENDTMVVSNPYEPQTGAGYRSARRAYLGYAYIKDKGLMKFGPQIPTDENFATAYVENALLSGFNIYVVDMEAGKQDRVRIGTEYDIVDFYHNGSEFSKVMVLTMWNDPEDIVVIK